MLAEGFSTASSSSPLLREYLVLHELTIHEAAVLLQAGEITATG